MDYYYAQSVKNGVKIIVGEKILEITEPSLEDWKLLSEQRKLIKALEG